MYLNLIKISLLATLILVFAYSSLVSANERIALVIGNADYIQKPLRNPVHDAEDIASVLRDELDFNVIEYHNLSRMDMLDAVNTFQTKLKNANSPIAFFYYSGHGIQSNNQNFLIPVDARIKKKHQIEAYGVNLNIILKAMRSGNIYLGVALLDACRNNPYETTNKGFGTSKGLARVDNISGIMVGYATKPGAVAEDGDSRNSPYASVLKKLLPLENYSVQDMLNEVGLRVQKQYGQEPWVSSSPVHRVVLASNNHSILPEKNKLKRNKRPRLVQFIVPNSTIYSPGDIIKLKISTASSYIKAYAVFPFEIGGKSKSRAKYSEVEGGIYITHKIPKNAKSGMYDVAIYINEIKSKDEEKIFIEIEIK